MVDHRFYLILLTLVLFISVINAERARNDNLQDEEIDFVSENMDNNEDDVIETIKRFLLKKTTTKKPTSDTISSLVNTTLSSKIIPTSTKSSIFSDLFNKKSSTTIRSSTSKYDRTRATTASAKDACGVINPCKNGGTCKTLSSGRYYCFCTSDYYGKTCENKFIISGSGGDKTDHCAKSPCRNGGECVGLRTTYYCRCKSPFYGTNCDKRITKREEIIDELNLSEQELNAYERDLQDDTEDLRQAIANENMLENYE